jgi:hypothetical protein
MYFFNSFDWQHTHIYIYIFLKPYDTTILRSLKETMNSSYILSDHIIKCIGRGGQVLYVIMEDKPQQSHKSTILL